LNWWNELNRPDDFREDWYGELTNQAAHTLLGAVLACGWCVAAFGLLGEMPYRSIVLGTMAVGYLAVEAIIQRWVDGDSWFDAAMFVAGGAGALLPMREVAVIGPVVRLDFDTRVWVAVAVPWALALILRVGKRYVAGHRNA
jgi:hypothetical protein